MGWEGRGREGVVWVDEPSFVGVRFCGRVLSPSARFPHFYPHLSLLDDLLVGRHVQAGRARGASLRGKREGSEFVGPRREERSAGGPVRHTRARSSPINPPSGAAVSQCTFREGSVRLVAGWRAPTTHPRQGRRRLAFQTRRRRGPLSGCPVPLSPPSRTCDEGAASWRVPANLEASIVDAGGARENKRKERVRASLASPRHLPRNQTELEADRDACVLRLSVCVYFKTQPHNPHTTPMPPRRRTPATPSRDAAGRFAPTPAAGGDAYLTPGEYVTRRDVTTEVELRK